MKTRYIIYFFAILTIILFISLYMIDIPAPSNVITEKFKLDIK